MRAMLVTLWEATTFPQRLHPGAETHHLKKSSPHTTEYSSWASSRSLLLSYLLSTPTALILQEMSHREAKWPRGKDHAVGGTTGRGLGLLVSASAIATHPCPRHAQRCWEVDQPESAMRVGEASAPTRSLTAAPSQRPGVPRAPLTLPHGLRTPGAQTQC